MERTRDAGDLDAWIGHRPIQCGCSRTHRIPIEGIRVGSGITDDVAELLPTADGDGPLLLVADPDTWDAAGQRVADALRRAGHAVRERVVGREPHADDVTLVDLRQTLACGPRAIVAVGAGTLNDLGKMLAQEADCPQMTVITAASMNGYTSSIAAMTIAGLKKTIPVRPPRVVVADTGVIADAPARLAAAGFGDLMSKPVSGADWVLSHWLFGDEICPTALSIADDAVARTRRIADAVGSGETDALEILTVALLFSGLSMSLAGASSPASGGEHLLSHYLDISERGWAREPRLHGEQVAVGTLVSLAVYDRLRAAAPSPGYPPPPARSTSELRRHHAHLSPAALDELLNECSAKARREPGPAARLERLESAWCELWGRLDGQLRGSAGLAEDLKAAGAPTSFGEIGVDERMARRLFLRARDMRNRYTVLDLAADLSLLDALADSLPF